MKKSLILVILLLASTNAFAKDKAWLLGIEAGSTKMDVKASRGGISASATTKGGHQAIKVGRYFGNNIRVYGSFYNFNEEDNVDVSAQSISADYLIGEESFKPFIGVNLTRFSYEESGLKKLGASKDSVKLSDTALGIQFGGLYSVNDNFDLEAGYKVVKTDASDTLDGVKIEADGVEGWYGGVNYNF